jgi:hypothetical protein
VDVPLPLAVGFALPVVGEAPGVANLAAGSPVVDPRSLGTPACATTHPLIVKPTLRTSLAPCAREVVPQSAIADEGSASINASSN